MKGTRTIQERWNSFEKVVLHPKAPPVQRQEMRRAFHAGAQSMLDIYLSLASDQVSEDAGVQIIQGCIEELELFFKQVDEGKA